MDESTRLPTIGEALVGAFAAFALALLLLLGLETAAGVAPLLIGLVLVGYALVGGLGLLVGRRSR